MSAAALKFVLTYGARTDRKADRSWDVFLKPNDRPIGAIRRSAATRRFIFFPQQYSFFTAETLMELHDFIEKKNLKHKHDR